MLRPDKSGEIREIRPGELGEVVANRGKTAACVRHERGKHHGEEQGLRVPHVRGRREGMREAYEEVERG